MTHPTTDSGPDQPRIETRYLDIHGQPVAPETAFAWLEIEYAPSGAVLGCRYVTLLPRAVTREPIRGSEGASGAQPTWGRP